MDRVILSNDSSAGMDDTTALHSKNQRERGAIDRGKEMSALSSSSAVCLLGKSPSTKNPRIALSRLTPLRVVNEPRRAEVSQDCASERSEADKIVDKIDFGELCNEFECISSPLVESTARQLARDILELREGNRALGTFAVSVKYKDPVRAFTGRERYKRALWLKKALNAPSVSVQDMIMLSTSVLNIKWTVRGRPKFSLASIGGDLIININSTFTLNQISGQVLEHEESWDVSTSSFIGQTYFWTSRRFFALTETGKDIAGAIADLPSRFSSEKENIDYYPDPNGDPTKFFERDDGFQRDVYQFALFVALIYFLVEFLKATL